MSRSVLCVSLVAASLSIGSPTLAQSADALTVLQVIESMGCAVGPDREADFIQALDMSGAEMQAAGNELMNAGLLQLNDEQLVYIGGACAASAPVVAPAPETLVATMIALRDNGCVVTEAGADDTLLPLGPRDVIMGHLRDLDEAHFALISGPYGGIVAADRVCNASDEIIATFAAQVPSMVALPRRDRLVFEASRPGARLLFVEWVVSEGCRAPSAGVMAGMGELGFDNTLAAVIVPLLEAGVLESSEGYLSVSAELCAGTMADRSAAVAVLPPGDAEFE